MRKSAASVTQIIDSYREGDKAAFEKLMPLVYDHLKKIAKNQMARQRSGHTLSPTALVNEAYLRIREKQDIVLRDRAHFFAVAAQCMRWLLMDYAKSRGRHKRGGAAAKVSFDENIHWIDDETLDLAALDEALEALGRQDERLCQVVELRYLAGLSVEETAEAMKTSPATVKRDWQLARAWLNRKLAEKEK